MLPIDGLDILQVATESDEQESEVIKRSPVCPPVQVQEPAALAFCGTVKNRDIPRSTSTNINNFFTPLF